MNRSTVSLLSVAAAVIAFGCGSGDQPAGRDYPPPATKAEESGVTDTPAGTESEGDGVRVVDGDSEFGSILMGSNRQAIYIFENDSAGESACYGECAEAWPPVLTAGHPVAGGGVRGELLGTIQRRDGETQVTYDGKPLYYYAHEGPGEVRCHNVHLNGGLWWVIGHNGKRRP